MISHFESVFVSCVFEIRIGQNEHTHETNTDSPTTATNRLLRAITKTNFTGRKSAGDGANLDRRLVPYTRDARRLKYRIEFIPTDL